MTGGGYGWSEGERIVPSYALTGGRTRSSGLELGLETLVVSTGLAAVHAGALQEEARDIIDLAERAVSIAEVGAALRVPIGVARVLVSDLAQAGYLHVSAAPATGADGRPTRVVLERLLDGLRAR